MSSLTPLYDTIPHSILDSLSELSGSTPISLSSDYYINLSSISTNLLKLDTLEVDDILYRVTLDLINNNKKTDNFNNYIRFIILLLNGIPNNEVPPYELIFYIYILKYIFKNYIELNNNMKLYNEFNVLFNNIENSTTINIDVSSIPATSISPIKSPKPIDTVISFDKTSNLSNIEINNIPRTISNSIPDEKLIERLIRSIFDNLIDIPVNNRTLNFHLELISLLIILSSTQLYSGIINNNIFIEPMLKYNRKRDLITALLWNFVERLPENKLQVEKNDVISKISSSISSLLMLPYTVYSFFFPPLHASFPLSDKSLLFLIVLCYQPDMDNAINFELSLAPTQEYDIKNNQFLQEITNMLDADTTVRDQNAKLLNPVPFNVIYDALASCIVDESALLLFYTFLHRNNLFREYVFAKSDIDVILVPLLEGCYLSDASCNRVYMVLIVLLILSQDVSFAENINSRIIIPFIPWFKERIISKISLGSLIIIILLRIMQKNLSKLRDPFIHTNCLAYLSNIASHTTHLHSYASERLVLLVGLLYKKQQKLSKQIMDIKCRCLDDSENFILEEKEQEFSTITEFIRTLLESIYLCIQPFSSKTSILTVTAAGARTTDRQNYYLIYSLLSNLQLLNQLSTIERFSDIVSILGQSCTYFDNYISRARLPELTVDSVLAVLAAASRNWHGVPAEYGMIVSDLKFSYEEQSHAEEFFLQYIWTIIFDVSKIKWKQTNKIVLFSVTQHELYNDFVNETIVNNINRIQSPTCDETVETVEALIRSPVSPPIAKTERAVSFSTESLINKKLVFSPKAPRVLNDKLIDDPDFELE